MQSPAVGHTLEAVAIPTSRHELGSAVRIKIKFALLRLCGAPHNRKAWLFAGSELAGRRAAIVMSLVQSAKLHGHDPWAYLRDVLTRMPTQLNSRIDELLPHIWQSTR